MNISPESRVGEIAAQHPLATRVFARYGIDFCCGGGVPLQQTCDKLDLDTQRVLDEIEQTLASQPGTADLGTFAEQWNRAPVGDLVRHIVDAYHVPLREELPRLEAMMRKVVRVHGDKDPERLGALLETFLRLETELKTHLTEEEETLFPAILRSEDEPADDLAPFVDDHTRVGRELRRLRELTDEYQAPEGACNTWNALWHGLAALEASLHEHIHLENNVLFPRLRAA